MTEMNRGRLLVVKNRLEQDHWSNPNEQPLAAHNKS